MLSSFRILAASAAAFLIAANYANQGYGADPAPPDVLARGNYLVGDAGQCTVCHGATFMGGPNEIPGPPGVPWAKKIPSLRGLPMFKTDGEALAFLQTAKLPSGAPALDPMPKYHFNQADAIAIVAYLRSLK